MPGRHETGAAPCWASGRVTVELSSDRWPGVSRLNRVMVVMMAVVAVVVVADGEELCQTERTACVKAWRLEGTRCVLKPKSSQTAWHVVREGL